MDCHRRIDCAVDIFADSAEMKKPHEGASGSNRYTVSIGCYNLGFTSLPHLPQLPPVDSVIAFFYLLCPVKEIGNEGEYCCDYQGCHRFHFM